MSNYTQNTAHTKRYIWQQEFTRVVENYIKANLKGHLKSEVIQALYDVADNLIEDNILKENGLSTKNNHDTNHIS